MSVNFSMKTVGHFPLFLIPQVFLEFHYLTEKYVEDVRLKWFIKVKYIRHALKFSSTKFRNRLKIQLKNEPNICAYILYKLAI